MMKVDAITNGSQNLCPVLICLAYMDKTADKRHPLTEELFISTMPPHKGIAPKMGARWLLMSIDRAGVDTAMFKAHSMCGAAASHKKQRSFAARNYFWRTLAIGVLYQESISPRNPRMVA
ncbi:MAG: hypothetical protein GY774_29285 [Planctomycetes bacterium]|nr:hypothetical protein [Planctomycetota bacterium]